MIICEIIVHLSFVVQNKKQSLFESNVLKISVLIHTTLNDKTTLISRQSKRNKDFIFFSPWAGGLVLCSKPF